ncbi:MAG: hypothetical protein CMC78_02985 [Flavobacteriaceae bacterium]|jgi:hypothetical protein|nr:hypothetical protein [Flavobacteriaceae bacterium]|tara:strand:- start:698 stop:955 length:258 start_codon:yes stop_codon:yes gene_type:complete
MVIKVLAAESDLTAASNVGNATLVRLYNGHSAVSVITRKDSGGNVIGSATVLNGAVEVFEKNATDTLTASAGGASVKVVKIAFTR